MTIACFSSGHMIIKKNEIFNEKNLEIELNS